MKKTVMKKTVMRTRVMKKTIMIKPRISSILPLILSVLAFVSLSSKAIDVDGLYSASIEIQQDTANRTLQRLAFTDVLIKVSGNSLVANNLVIKKALNRPREYLVKQSETRVADKRFFNTSFNSQKINRLLRTSGFGVWGKNRPQQVIWLVVDEDFARTIRGESDLDYAQFIQNSLQQAGQRAIPLLFPIMDLDDELEVSSADLWGQFTAPVERGSVRYGADNYVIAKIIKLPEDYQLSWSMYGRNSKSQPFEIWLNGKSQGQLPELGLELSNTLANYLGEKYSVKVSGKNEQVFLTIDRVNETRDYAQLMAMFSRLSAVGEVDLSSVTGSSVQLKLTLLGTPEDLLKELELDSRINSIQNSFGDTRFEWAGQ